MKKCSFKVIITVLCIFINTIRWTTTFGNKSCRYIIFTIDPSLECPPEFRRNCTTFFRFRRKLRNLEKFWRNFVRDTDFRLIRNFVLIHVKSEFRRNFFGGILDTSLADPDLRIRFLKSGSGSGWAQKGRIRPDPDPDPT